eukprot:TRINITY_DN6333_c0_g1_i1.p1 TRINITY_DN6333_c0_g1~~TRINITY_DN6333_c0_g1_i1.p1  ORF type:complete len:135 (+),score=33.10 TRINITY_DN6333_c0_g1_i1:48-452(+)
MSIYRTSRLTTLIVSNRTITPFIRHYTKAAHHDLIEIPRRVSENAKEGLDLHKKHGRGGTDVGINMAMKLAKGDPMPFSEVKHIAEYFPRHAVDNLDKDGKDGDKVSNGYIAWQLWGGDAGREWASNYKEGDTK